MGALGLIAAAALAAAPPAETEASNAPTWAELPSAAAVHAAYPSAAKRRQISGRAKIKCRVNLKGRLEDCVVIGETPPGWGFGQGALTMSAKFRMRPRVKDGEPVGGASVTVPVSFILHEGLVQVECDLTPSGLTRDCRVLSEDPPDRGLGKSVVAYAEGREPDRSASRVRDGKVTWRFYSPIPIIECAAGETKFPCSGPAD